MKMIVLFRRKPGLTPEQFREYYETRHVPLALKLFPYFKDYRRNYIRRDLVHRRADGATNPSLDFDAVMELTFASKSDYERMVREMADPKVRAQVVEDEERFLDRSATVVFMVDEERSPLSA